MRNVRLLLGRAGVMTLAVLPVTAVAQSTIKLATFAPANTTWHKALLDMGNAWATTTGGRVKLRVYAGGTQGSEASTVKMMRPGVDQLQAALLMQPGLTEIDDVFAVFGIPFFFASDEELAHVQRKLTPIVQKRLEAKGFHLLNWGNGGWIQLFSKKDIRTLADVKQTKLYTTEGNDRMVQWYKANGFHPVALPANEILPQLKTGMIDTAPSPPYPASILQMYRDAPNMLELSVGPLVAATVITIQAWKSISDADRQRLLEAAAAMEQRIQAEAPKLDADAVAAMQKRGLKVVKLDAAAAREFRAAAEKLTATMRGSMVAADVFDLALRERDAFRASISR